MSEERDHVIRDTEEDTVTGKRRRGMMRKEEERAEAEEGPIYPTSPEGEMPRTTHAKKPSRPKKEAG